MLKKKKIIIIKNIKRNVNLKKNILKKIKNNFMDLEFFNIVSSNVFKNYLSVGKNKSINDTLVMLKFLNMSEFLIFITFFKFTEGYINDIQFNKILEDNLFFKNILYFIVVIRTLNWSQFCDFSKQLNKLSVSQNSNEVNLTITTLNYLKNLEKIKSAFFLYRDGLISEAHLRFTINTYKINKNIINLYDKLNLSELINLDNNFNLMNFKYFKNDSVSFYDALIQKYEKHAMYNQWDRRLSIFAKKKYLNYLNISKRKGVLSYAENLAYQYLGNPYEIPYAKRQKNLHYRAYRLFLHIFKLKPFKLWQITRKGRMYKGGGTIYNHLHFYEFNVKKILLLSNFFFNLKEIFRYFKDNLVCINGKIVKTPLYKIKPFDFIHFIDKIQEEERLKFMLNLRSIDNKIIFKRRICEFFEYNFSVMGFIILPEFFFQHVIGLAPYYTIYNSGRFQIEKLVNKR